MKTILVPTDFSEASRNAAEYAFEFAKVTQSKIILFHAYHIPVQTVDATVIMVITPQELEKENINRLNIEAEHLKSHGENISIEFITRAGFATDEIIDMEEELKPDLIVMGMKEAGKVSEFLIGSTATAILKSAQTPVLIIPEKARFTIPSKIALASDYKFETNAHVLDPLKEIAKLFGSQILIVNVVKEKENIEIEKGVAGMQMENYFENIEHSYYFPEDSDTIKGINQFVKNNQVDLLTIIPHKHNLLENLFRKSHSKGLAFHTEIPILALPDNHKNIPAYL